MLRKKARPLSVLFSLVLAAIMFAGCQSNSNNNTAATKKPESSATTATSAEAEKNGDYAPSTDLELTIWNTQGNDVMSIEKPDEDLPGDWLANKTKVKIKEFYGNGGQQWEPKLTTLVASGNLPDLVLTQAGQGPAHHAKLHEGDLNWELTPEMLQKYAPDVWKFVPSWVWDSIKIDGKIYGIPFSFTVDEEVDSSLSSDFITAFTLPRQKATWNGGDNILAVRDDILKELIPSAMDYKEIMDKIKTNNAPMGDQYILPIKSSDEYIKFMYDVKALGLKEGNKPVYAFGYAGGDNWPALSILGAEMLGYKGYNYTGWLNIADKKMGFGYLDPVFKEAASIQNKMINDKVIDPESLVHNGEKFKEKVLNGQYAIVAINYVDGIDTVNTNLEKAGKPFRYVPFFTQVPQRAEYPAFKEGPQSFNETLSLMKTLKEDEVPQVLNWINTMFTDEWDDIRFWGTKEAGLYEDLTDGTRKFKEETMNKLLLDGDLTAMDWKKAKGLMTNNIPFSGGTPGFWNGVQKWNNFASSFERRYFNKTIKYATVQASLKFPADSEWTKGFVPVPNIQSWSPEYANIPEVQELWSKRASWDDPFKVTLTAKNEEEFSKKWDAAIANFRKVIDVDKMLEEQTKIVLPLLEQRTAQAAQK
ncbi:hypothetical protein [Paenibacillus nasutitermitis]|uniref:ABC transporter substrate-binding protein n=1 Tax=Paenibacillus nasutitermitis TaxID=1652958 RepID=A0A916ZI34_9BACL|nr:hypothetical protein [Paenibacillus nasutitermitis]GGD98754.1 hypothetical protein GCM10010911_66980 [Paenibacillus nasutitermitis]